MLPPSSARTSTTSHDHPSLQPPLGAFSRLSASSQPSDLLPLHHSNYQQQPPVTSQPTLPTTNSQTEKAGRIKEGKDARKGGSGGGGGGKAAWNWAAKLRESQQTAAQERDQNAGKKDPWIERKAAVGMVIAIVVYTSYVMIGRLCVPMITRSQPNRGSRGRGIAFLSVYLVTLSMFIWSYSKIVLTGPGFVRDYVKPTPIPEPSSIEDASSYSSPYSQYNPSPPGPPLPPYNHPPTTTSSENFDSTTNIPTSIPFPPSAMPTHLPQPSSPPNPHPHPNHSDPSPNNTLPHPITSPPLSNLKPQPKFVKRPRSVSNPPPQGWLERVPPFPEERFKWCRFCNWTKPERSHHCRICGTCVLVMDHHCPWVGTCVGAQNHKFFILFLLHSTLYTLSILILSSLTLSRLQSQSPPTLDGFLVSMIVLSGFFTLFTSPLLGSHVWLVLHNLTTIEQLRVSAFERSENAKLDLHYGSWGWGAMVEKQSQHHLWKRQWGASLASSGNLYYLSPLRNWTSKMGSNPLGWILPIYGSREDGSEFRERNERCGPEGEWRRREEWPEESRGRKQRR